MVFAKRVKAATLGVAAALAFTLGTAGSMAADAKKTRTGCTGCPAAAGAQKHADVWYKLCIDVPTPEPTKPGEQPKQQKPEEMKKVERLYHPS